MSGSAERHSIGIPLLRKIDNLLGNIETWLSVIVFVIMLTLMVVQVIFRYFLQIGIPWVEELIRFLFVATSFIAAAYLSKDRDHIVIDIINTPIYGIQDDRKRLLTDRRFWLIADFISLIITILITYRCHIFTRNMLRTHQYSPSMEVPMFAVTIFMEIGFALMATHYLIKTIDGTYFFLKTDKENIK